MDGREDHPQDPCMERHPKTQVRERGGRMRGGEEEKKGEKRGEEGRGGR